MSQNDHSHKNPPKELNHIRTDIRCDETTENYTKREILTPLLGIFQTFPEIPNITEDFLNSSWKYIQSYYQYSQLFAKIFPYQLFFQIISDNPNNNVKFLAMKHISFFSQFDSFPFQDFVTSPFLEMFSTILQSSTSSTLIDQILFLFTNLMKAATEFRDQFISHDILSLLSNKLLSFRIPMFLETLHLIDPQPPIEIFEQVAPFFEFFMKLIYEPPTQLNLKITRSALRSLCHLMKAGIHYYDNMIQRFLNDLLLFDDIKIVCNTCRIIGFIDCPTIQYCETCFNRIFNDFENESIYHTFLKVLIRKHQEWSGFMQDIINETILFQSTCTTKPFLKNLYLQVMLLYFPFNQSFDERMCDLLLFFLNDPLQTHQILTALQIIMSEATFEEGEKETFIELIENGMDDFNIILQEGNHDLVLMTSEFLENFEVFKQN